MAFFAFYDNDLADPSAPPSPPPARATPLPKEIRCCLRLFVNPITGEFDYKFCGLTYLLENKEDVLLFYIQNEIPNTKAYFSRHMRSGADTNMSGKKRISIDTLNGKTPDAIDPYAIMPTRASFKFDLDNEDMIHVGLVVKIVDNSPSPQLLKTMLCDPQVGNGPP